MREHHPVGHSTRLALGLVASTLLILGLASIAQATDDKVTICHATSSETNPYNAITVGNDAADWAPHLDSNGSPLAGHEKDFLLPFETDDDADCTVGIDIEKSNDADGGPVPPGTEVEYTYEVTNTGNAPLEIESLWDNVKGTDDVACDLDGALPDEDDGDDGILSPGETWTFHCSTTLDETTTNQSCVVAEIAGPADLAPAHVQPLPDAYDCDENTVVVGKPATPTPTPEGSQLGGTGTPAPSLPNGAMGLPSMGGPLATLGFGAILLSSLGALAYANMRTVRSRR